MKKLYFLFVALLITCSAFSQAYKPMLKENKTWDVAFSDYPDIYPYCATVYSRAFLKKDTVISGLTYFKLNYYDIVTPCVPDILGGTWQGLSFDTTFYYSNILLREDSVSRKVWLRTISDTSDFFVV